MTKVQDPWIGRLLAKRYKLQAIVGRGSMGKVYQAADTVLGGVAVAVKFLSQALMDDKGKERFASEARACALLGNKSIHIVRVMDYGVDETELPFYVMEYLQGESLREMVDVQPLTLEQFLPLAQQISRGLQAAHQGIEVDGRVWSVVHRDIKPSNIFVVRDPGLGMLAKVLDFGIAKFVNENPESNQTSHFTGTLAYCSPEQLEGRSLGQRSDIYSLGVMMFEMLTGQVPIQAPLESIGAWYRAHHMQAPPSLQSINPKLPKNAELEGLIQHCLAKDPQDRPANMVEVIQALDRVEQSLRPKATPATLSTPDDHTYHPQVSTGPSLERSADSWDLLSWPKDKPVQKIVFPKLIPVGSSQIPSLWTMLPRHEINQRVLNRCYNQFLFTSAPHPMVLWVTALYQVKQDPRWLPCYLDLKRPEGQEICRCLGEIGHYYLLLFSLEEPGKFCHRLEVSIATGQRPLLQEWADQGQISRLAPAPDLSKDLLRREYERLKPQILARLSQQLQMS
ncbi:serine/threonine protein kinase [Gloeomargarita lithophora Alchichica-D10]|uniref:Serine/threonine protein kinase n=1 Tax=Gloeomargarita lithophora Alchichica-D10 TaxID=1188229 RepID=A0A1J0AB35_9CYAN|nr:serine/threonine-protein kinase [Gloeomargarita lithophora]APB33113.1 serine/threonine protein kinase [Gloeomargarita lithophora Alchichica-D10]